MSTLFQKWRNQMNRRTIKNICARSIIDGRGYPTVEVDVVLENDTMGRASVPIGLSTGEHEAKELRDGGKRYRGLGVQKAVEVVNSVIAPALIGYDVTKQRHIDFLMTHDLDGTPNKGKLGANAIVGVSMAVARAAASSLGVPLYRYLNPNARVLPVPLFNLINGGMHASGNLEIQEFIIMPIGADNFSDALHIATEVGWVLKDLIIKKYGKIAANTGDEGGFVPPMNGVREPLDTLVQAVEMAGFADKIVYGLDIAASHFYDREENLYHFDGKKLTTEAMIDLYKGLCQEYQIASIEDPLYENDFEAWATLTAEVDCQIVGDDFFVTNYERVTKGIQMQAANAVLWKINQIGTLTEALDVAELAYRNGYGVQVSERSGETEDPILADFCVALNAGQVKTGATVRGERTSKYNQFLRIEQDLGDQAVYAGANFRWANL
jgi:enolase